MPGSVLAQLARTGEADKDELLTDILYTQISRWSSTSVDRDMELLRELIKQGDQGVSMFIVHERAGVQRHSAPRTRIFAADSAEQAIAHCMAGTPFIMGAPSAGVWHGYIGTPQHHAERPAVIVYTDVPSQRSAMGIPQHVGAGVVLGTDGLAITADGRDQAVMEGAI
jgi:hypothetical protein